MIFSRTPKESRLFVSGLFVLSILLSCTAQNKDSFSYTEEELMRNVSNQGLPSGSGVSQELVASLAQLVPLGDAFNVVSAWDGELDKDLSIEQVALAYNESWSSLELLVLDYAVELDEPLITLKEKLPLMEGSSLFLRVEDWTQDDLLDILVWGKNSQGESHFLFWAGMENTHFKKIFEQSFQGEVLIVGDKSFVLSKNSSQQEGVHQDESYRWDPATSTFVLEKFQRNSRGLERAREQISFLEGPWYRVERLRGQAAYFFLNPSAELLEFANSETYESFRWRRAGESFSRMSFFAYNDLVESIEMNFTIHILDENTISINAEQDSARFFSGEFKRVLMDVSGRFSLQDSAYSLLHEVPDDLRLAFSGEYTSESKASYTFLYPQVIYSQDNKKNSGSFEILSVGGELVLQWQFFDDYGLLEEKSFMIEQRKQETSQFRVINLILKPVRLYFDRVESLEEPWVELEKVETRLESLSLN